MTKQLVTIDIPQDDVYRLLAALKVAELQYGTLQRWDASQYINKLHSDLTKQIFTYEKE
mgnify:FL=1